MYIARHFIWSLYIEVLPCIWLFSSYFWFMEMIISSSFDIFLNILWIKINLGNDANKDGLANHKLQKHGPRSPAVRWNIQWSQKILRAVRSFGIGGQHKRLYSIVKGYHLLLLLHWLMLRRRPCHVFLSQLYWTLKHLFYYFLKSIYIKLFYWAT